jgi:hypothetical protein
MCTRRQVGPISFPRQLPQEGRSKCLYRKSDIIAVLEKLNIFFKVCNIVMQLTIHLYELSRAGGDIFYASIMRTRPTYYFRCWAWMFGDGANDFHKVGSH